jgi:hypothetical protein
MTDNSNGAQPICECERPLKPDETACPNCTRDKSSFWKQIGAVAATVTPVIISGVVFVVTKGRVKPGA